jgi:hypothetical protein
MEDCHFGLSKPDTGQSALPPVADTLAPATAADDPLFNEEEAQIRIDAAGKTCWRNP